MEIYGVLALLVIAYITGSIFEKRHYKSIITREKALNRLPAIASKIYPSDTVYEQKLVSGSVAVSVDYFKRFLAALHNIIGGDVTSYETLLDRARREALLRMKEEADKIGAKLVLNVKYETSAISRGAGNSLGTVEVLAYGTAMIPKGMV